MNASSMFLGLALIAPALSGAGSPPRSDEEALAPDGQRGLGAEADVQELVRLFRSSDEEDQSFRSRLRQLPGDAAILCGSLREEHRARGYFELLKEPREVRLPALHAAFLSAQQDPIPVLAAGDDRARAFATMSLDPRFRVRLELVAEREREVAELTRGLAVLRAMCDGYVEIGGEEGRDVAARVDLAASRLRAMCKDLAALRSVEGSSRGPSAEAVEELLAVGRQTDRGAQLRALAEIEAGAQRARNLMREALFTVRLETATRALLNARESRRQKAAERREQALAWLPGGDTDDTPTEVLVRSKGDRMRQALEISLAGLAHDPMDEDLAWIAAVSTDFRWGRLQTRPWYDRFLALRGIRAHDHRTYESRDLDTRETKALWEVQQPLGGPGGR